VCLHICSILGEGELDEAAVIKDYSTPAADGKQYRVERYTIST